MTGCTVTPMGPWCFDDRLTGIADIVVATAKVILCEFFVTMPGYGHGPFFFD